MLFRSLKNLSVCVYHQLWRSDWILQLPQTSSFQHFRLARFGVCGHFMSLQVHRQYRHNSLLKLCSIGHQVSNNSRHFHLSRNTWSESENSDDLVNITYIDREGESHHIKAKVGDNVMYLAQKHDIEIEGACEASLACCTCHVYVENYFDKLNEIEEEEEDMLDLAPFLQENSRLSCQIILSKELDGLVVRLPSATRNFYVDGHVPKPH